MYLIIGVCARAMISSSEAAGEHATGLDFFGDVDANLRSQTYSLTMDYELQPTVSNLFQVARGFSNIDGLLYLSGPENQPWQLRFWQERGLLLGNGCEAFEAVRNPMQLRDMLEEIHISMPRFHGLSEAPEIFEKKFLLKPLNRGSGHGIVDIAPGTSWKSSVKHDPNPQTHILQEYCPGINASFTFLADGRQARMIGTSRQLDPHRGYLYRGNIAPLDPQIERDHPGLLKRFELIANHLTKTAALAGLNTVDVVIQAGDVWVLEVNPRWSASVELFETLAERSLFIDHVQACKGLLQPLLPPNETAGFVGKAIVNASRTLQVHYPEEDSWRELYAWGVRDLPRNGSIIEEHWPLCTVLASAPTTSACQAALSEAERRVWEWFVRNGSEMARK